MNWPEGIPDSVIAVYEDLGSFQKGVVDGYLSISNGIEYSTDKLIIGSAELGIISKIWELLIPLALSLMLFYLLVKLLEDLTNNFKKVDLAYLSFFVIKGVLGTIFLSYGPYVVIGILQISNYFVKALADSPIGMEDVAGTSRVEFYRLLIESAKDMAPLEALSLLVYSYILKFAGIIPNAMIILHAITRKIEVILRGATIGVAMTDIAANGTHSAGFRSIKKFAAACLHGFVILAVCQIATALGGAGLLDTIIVQGHIQFSDVGAFMEVILYNFAAVGMISASKAILNDVFS